MLLYTTDAGNEYINELTNRLGCPVTHDKPANELYLCYENGILSLCRDNLSMFGDFTEMQGRIMPGRLGSEMLVKAAKYKPSETTPVAIDATAGMAEDSFLLAAAGYHVHLYERDMIICALLENALKRAALIPSLSDIAARMELHNEDSIFAMNSLPYTPDLIYLDPMFPARSKSGLIKKKFQLLQQLEAPCSEEAELMDAAILTHPKKLIVKRPLKGPFLAEKKPGYSHPGKAIRYDVYINL